jgi:hypothetical protein
MGDDHDRHFGLCCGWRIIISPMIPQGCGTHLARMTKKLVLVAASASLTYVVIESRCPVDFRLAETDPGGEYGWFPFAALRSSVSHPVVEP